MSEEFNYEKQKLFLEVMVQHPESFVRVQNIFNKDNFTSKLRETADFINTHCEKYTILPDIKQIKVSTGLVLETVDTSYEDWFLDEFEKFTKKQELERAVLQSADLLEKGEFGPIEKIIKDAVQISLTKDMGVDYFEDPRARLEAIKANNGQIKTGWDCLDSALYGGFNRGELEIFSGSSGAGKSLFLQNLAVNWAEQQMNGIFLTLELSEELCCQRIDGMMTDTASKNIFKELDDVVMKVGMKQKKCGNLQVKYMQAQSNVNDIRSYIRELHVQTGENIDFICVDYLDLLMPVSVKVDPSNLFIKDKYVSEELRNLAKELNIVLVTAAQLNRSAAEEVEFDHSMISGGISKINSADNVFGIYTSRSMREQGRYQLQLMKTRSSAGVGKKVDLEFNVDTLRIIDAGLDSNDFSSGGTTSSAIMNSIKNKSTVSVPDANVTSKGTQMSNKLAGLMTKINN